MPLEIGDYIVGDEDLEAILQMEGYGEGWEDEYDVGAPVRRPPARRAPAGLQQRAMARQAGAKVLQYTPPTQSRQYPLGFDSGAAGVAAGANVLITSRPQQIFRPERLILSSASAPAFLINDILVGNRSQLVAAGALPGDAFRPDAQGVRLKCDVARVSQDITLSVTNLTAAIQRFNAALIGDVVQ